MFGHRTRCLGASVAIAWLTASAAMPPPTAAGARRPRKAPRPASRRLKSYPGKYYVIYSDLDANAVREASARMSAMAAEYHRRTKDFAGSVRGRLAFYLFRRPEDYYNAGGPKGSAGVFLPQEQALMALAEYGTDDELWHIIQHEGFHQFAEMVIGGEIPVWIEEGLAEYFGQAVWTGDGFVTGLIPPYRLRSLQGYIRAGKILSFQEILQLTSEEWSDDLAGGRDANSDRTERGRINYDQAWSMVHFLVHAQGGKYRGAFSSMIRDISRGRNWMAAFQARFGSNVQAFEKRYKDWWLARPANPTEDLYIKAVVQTLTSFLARAVSQGQTFKTAEEFFRQARSGALKSHKTQWLPPSLLEKTLVYARGWRRGWSLKPHGTHPKLVLTWADEKVYTGTFTHARGKVYRVTVTVADKKD